MTTASLLLEVTNLAAAAITLLIAALVARELVRLRRGFPTVPERGRSLDIASLRGKVVLVDFWTYSCINCIRTLPHVTELHRKYAKRGLVIVGVHSPEFEYEKEPDGVRDAIREHGIEYPVAMDNDLVTWRNYDYHYWPAQYLIDDRGRIRYTHFGEGRYDTIEQNVRDLLDASSAGSGQKG